MRSKMIIKKYHSEIYFFLLLLVFSNFGCQPSDKSSAEQREYVKEIEEWQQRRLKNLTKPDGWLSLIGLFWLKEGENRFGSSSANPVRFPAEKAPAVMGSFTLQNDRVTVSILNNLPVLHEGKPVQSMEMQNDLSENPTILNYGSLSWFVIKRGDKYGIRLRDSESETIKNFKGLDYFPIDPGWKIQARFEPYSPAKKISIPNVLGTESEETCPGALVFEKNGQRFRLDPILEDNASQWFIIFSDETNGKETYGAGRFLYADPPDQNGITFLDFNKAYNPPCAFTPYATCPLPPEQNYLNLMVTAGEKKYQGSNY